MANETRPTCKPDIDFPDCGSGGMFIQSAEFMDRRHNLSFYGQERIDTTLRLGRMNLILHGLDGDIRSTLDAASNSLTSG